MRLPQSNVLLVESVDSVNHLLYELHLGVSQPVFVGDVVGYTWTERRQLERRTKYRETTHQSGHQTLPWYRVAGGEVPHTEQPTPWVPAWSSRAGRCGRRLSYLEINKYTDQVEQ